MDSASKEPVPVLAVTGLSVRLGVPSTEVVRNVGFSVSKGEVVGLAGESGSGKSVTAMAFTRLLPAAAKPRYSGNIKLSGIDGNLLELPERQLRRIRGSRIGYVFQEPSASFNPLFTIKAHLREVLMRVGSASATRDERIARSLEEVGIPADREHLNAYPGQFSGGMLQRVALACAILGSPDLIVADEPTTALDTTTQKRIVDLLAALNRDHGTAILFISHDLGLLKQISTRLLVMREGELVEAGGTASVLHSPKHQYTRRLVECAPKLRL